jgi:hypothetical protein
MQLAQLIINPPLEPWTILCFMAMDSRVDARELEPVALGFRVARRPLAGAFTIDL